MCECRDCKICNQSAVGNLLRKGVRASLIVATSGASEVAQQGRRAVKRICPHCGHAMSQHTGQSGR